jgi:hypothetical protein
MVMQRDDVVAHGWQAKSHQHQNNTVSYVAIMRREHLYALMFECIMTIG